MKAIELSSSLMKGAEGMLPQAMTQAGIQTDNQKAGAQASGVFESMLGQMFEQAQSAQVKVQGMNSDFATVDMGKIHENVIALEEANISLKMLVGVRNKLLEAYKELTHLN